MILLADLLAATGGQVHGPIGSTTFESFCFDSPRHPAAAALSRGKDRRGDGHDHIADACAAGAAGALCQHPVDTCATCIVVPDTRQAIQDWACHILAKQQVEIIGITGSVGKTTAKEAIAAVLGALAPDSAVFKNRANYNGLYGLPIALGELRPEQRIAVLEMAADHLGEISRLARIAPPDIAVVTTVEPAHLEAPWGWRVASNSTPSRAAWPCCRGCRAGSIRSPAAVVAAILDDSYSASPAVVEAGVRETLAAGRYARHRSVVLGEHAGAGRLRNDRTRTGGQAGGPCPRPPRDQGEIAPAASPTRACRRHAGRPGRRDVYPRGRARAVLERLAPGDVGRGRGRLPPAWSKSSGC